MDVEWLILADHAEIVNSKLFLLGGGWEAIAVNTLPARLHFAVAVAFAVPWNETNVAHPVSVLVMDEDGREHWAYDGQVEVGRPRGVPVGHAQRVQLAFNLDLPIERLGTYAAIARIAGNDARRVRFNVTAGPGFADKRPRV